MPSVLIFPRAIGTWNQGTNVGGANKMASLQAYDDDASYVSITPPGALVDSYTSTDWPSDVGSINSLGVYCRRRNSSGSGSILQHGRLGGTVAGNYTGGSYADQVVIDSPPPAVGALPTTEMTIVCTSGTTEGRFTYLRMDLDYVAAGGCFIPIFNAILPLLGSCLQLADMPAINQILRKKGHWLNPDEYLEAFRQMKTPRRIYVGV